MIRIEIDPANPSRPELLAVMNLVQHLLNAPTPAVIAHADRPDVGAPPPLPLPPAPTPQPQTAAWLGGPVGGAAVQVVPLPPAPSTAAAVPSPTAPAALPAGAPPPTSGVPLSVPSTAQMGAVLNAAPSSPASGGVELDAAGLPWDQRIHSSSRVKLDNGCWKKKKGINNPSFVGQVETELRNLMANRPPLQAVPPAPAPMPQQPVPPQVWTGQVPPAPMAQQLEQMQQAAAAMVPPAPQPVAPPIQQPAAAPAVPTTYEELTHALASLLKATPALALKLQSVLQELGVPQLPLLANRPDLIPAFWFKLTAA